MYTVHYILLHDSHGPPHTVADNTAGGVHNSENVDPNNICRLLYVLCSVQKFG